MARLAQALEEMSSRPATEPRPAFDPLRFSAHRRQTVDYLPTGVPELDRRLGGGLPRGRLVEVTGGRSSGRTSLLFSILARATRRDEWVAYVDAFDSMAPECASRAGTNLDRLLWVRCGHGTGDAVESALKAADILVQGGGFGVIVLDLDSFSAVGPRRIPLPAWFRLQRAVKGIPTILLVLSRHRAAGGAASPVLFLERRRSCWDRRGSRASKPSYQVALPDSPAAVADPNRLESRLRGLESSARLLKGEAYGAVSVFCRF
jgi:recombination protein RecA